MPTRRQPGSISYRPNPNPFPAAHGGRFTGALPHIMETTMRRITTRNASWMLAIIIGCLAATATTIGRRQWTTRIVLTGHQ